MQAYLCSVCGYLYDQESAERDREGNLTEFENLDDQWICPVCGVQVGLFKPIESDRTADVPVSDDKK